MARDSCRVDGKWLRACKLKVRIKRVVVYACHPSPWLRDNYNELKARLSYRWEQWCHPQPSGREYWNRRTTDNFKGSLRKSTNTSLCKTINILVTSSTPNIWLVFSSGRFLILLSLLSKKDSSQGSNSKFPSPLTWDHWNSWKCLSVFQILTPFLPFSPSGFYPPKDFCHLLWPNSQKREKGGNFN